jgi:predicted DNA-binding transcriptional regulator YafY
MTENTIPENRSIRFGYVNWRGEFAMRTVTPVHIFWGATKYHPQPGWMLEAFDHDKQALRSFALVDCDFQANRSQDEVTF